MISVNLQLEQLLKWGGMLFEQLLKVNQRKAE